MAWQLAGSSPLRRTVSKQETKACALCAALNYHQNSECMACGWRGAFEQDSAAVDYHWQRLMERYEEVRLEHVTSRHISAIGDFGKPRKASAYRRMAAAWGQLWGILASFCANGRTKRETTSRPKSIIHPN